MRPQRKRVKRYFTCLVIAANDEQAWRGIPRTPTIAHVHAIDDGISKRPAALDDSPAHEAE